VARPARPRRQNAITYGSFPRKHNENRIKVATDYDEARPDVAESRNAALQALRSANAPDARSVASALDEAGTTDGVELPCADLSDEVLAIEVIPQKDDEFTCYACFLVGHRSRRAAGRDGHASCLECEG